jgi:hypothetical protein
VAGRTAAAAARRLPVSPGPPRRRRSARTAPGRCHPHPATARPPTARCAGPSRPAPPFAVSRREAYALIREALTTSGDICPGPGELLIRLDPLTAPRRTKALAALCDQLTATGACYPGTDLVLRYEVKSHPSPA